MKWDNLHGCRGLISGNKLNHSGHYTNYLFTCVNYNSAVPSPSRWKLPVNINASYTIDLYLFSFISLLGNYPFLIHYPYIINLFEIFYMMIIKMYITRIKYNMPNLYISNWCNVHIFYHWYLTWLWLRINFKWLKLRTKPRDQWQLQQKIKQHCNKDQWVL